MRGPTVLLLALLGGLSLVLVQLAALDRREGPGADRGQELVLYCAAGIRRPVEELCAEYERRYGVRVLRQYAGSGTLLSSLQAAGTGDLYLAGDASFVERARELGLARERFALARMRPVLAVAAGNPLGLAGLGDLARDDVRVGIGDPDAAAVGKVTRRVLSGAGLWEPVRAAVKVTEPTVEGLATALTVGALDAAVIWDATARAHGLEFVACPELDAAPREVTLGVLAASARPTSALRFARFLAAADAGGPAFERFGFEALPGDPWTERPTLELFSGAMLNAAIDARIAAFEEREGVDVRRTYNGCGILVAQMRAGAAPDAYFACDVSFLDAVRPAFEPEVAVSRNPLVLIVPRDNPRALGGIADLARPGLRVGFADEHKSALGALTRAVLRREGLEAALLAAGNLRVEVPTGDLLVNQLRTGALDAAVVYTSNAARAGGDVTRLAIEDAAATQPWAVARETEYPRLAARLREWLTDAASRAAFEELGFEWLLPDGGLAR